MSQKSVTLGDIDDHPQVIIFQLTLAVLQKEVTHCYSVLPQMCVTINFVICFRQNRYCCLCMAHCKWSIWRSSGRVFHTSEHNLALCYCTSTFNLYYLLLKSDGTRMETKVFRKPTVLTLADCYIFKAKYGLLSLRLFVENNDSSRTCPILYKSSFQWSSISDRPH